MDVGNINIVMEVIESVLRDPSKPWNKPLGWVEGRTGVSRFRQFLIVVFAVSFLLSLGFGTIARVTSNAIGFAFPTYLTIALMETPPVSYANADGTGTNKWLTYWPAFAAILIVEQHFEFILSFVPFYLLFKTLFFIWCTVPIKNNGVAVLDAYARPYLEKYFD